MQEPYALETPTAPLADPALLAAAGFLAGYSGTTRTGYRGLRGCGRRVRCGGGGRRSVGRWCCGRSLLGLNGLRVSEACNANIENLGLERGHRTLLVDRKGGKRALIPLAPRTSRALDLAIGERHAGPILLGQDGTRLDRYAAYRIVRRLAKRAGIPHRVHPHCLRHAFITAALDAGVPLRDVQEAASHSDPRTTSRYDRHRVSLDRHAAYTVAAFVAGATNGR